jgi:cytochrome oxidase assembly protein ShyY1
MTAQAPRRKRSVLIPSLFTVAACCVLIGLGVWQLERLAWKESLIAALARRVSAPPMPLEPASAWPKLDPSADEFRRVSLRVQFIPGSEARVYSGGAGLRDDVKGPGYFAFAPARLADGSTVVINRGHVANPNPDASLKPIALPEKSVDVVGALRSPERPGWFVTPYSERQDLWLVRDPLAMAARYSWGEVAPFYIELESPTPPGGVPKPGPLTVKLRNDHFGYAMTWFGLAAVLAIMFGVWTVSRAQRSTQP